MAVKVIAFLVLLLCVVCNAAGITNSKVVDLRALRAKNKNGMIPLDKDIFSYISKGKRPYNSVILFSSSKIAASRPQLKLVEAESELSLVAKAYSKSEDKDNIFFFVAYFEQFEGAFSLFGIQSVPVVVRIESGNKALTLPLADREARELKARYPWTAEDVVEWLKELGLSDVKITRPSIFNSPKRAFVFLVVVAMFAMSAYSFIQSRAIFHPSLWIAASLVIFWFSVSGGMHSIIRSVPLFEINELGIPSFFPKEIGKSHSAIEGFIVGGTYLMFSGSLSLIIFGLPKLQSRPLRTAGSVSLTLIALYSIYNVFTFWRAKTGYQLVSYL